VGCQYAALPTADQHLFARIGRLTARVRPLREVSEGPRMARLDTLLRILSRRYGAGIRGKSPDGMDKSRRQAHRAERQVRDVV